MRDELFALGGVGDRRAQHLSAFPDGVNVRQIHELNVTIGVVRRILETAALRSIGDRRSVTSRVENQKSVRRVFVVRRLTGGDDRLDHFLVLLRTPEEPTDFRLTGSRDHRAVVMSEKRETFASESSGNVFSHLQTIVGKRRYERNFATSLISSSVTVAGTTQRSG